MTISMKRAMEILNEKKDKITLNELMFVLTVFRDNAEHDDVHEFLDAVLKGSQEKMEVLKELRLEDINEEHMEKRFFQYDEIGYGYDEDENGNGVEFAEIDIDLVVWIKEEFQEIYNSDTEVYEIVSVRAQEVIGSDEPKILVNWKDDSYKENKKVQAAIEESILELQGEFSGNSDSKKIEITINYTEKGEKKVQQLVCQSPDSNEKDLVYFALDHLSLWEFEKALHQYINWTVSIDSLDYKIDGVTTVVDGKKAEQIFLAASF